MATIMEIDIYNLLMGNPILVFFLVLGFGYLLGNLTIRGVGLGPTPGVLIAGLFFGHFGFGIPGQLERIGFIFFMYSVGLQAGPRFIGVLREDGLRYACLALVTGLSAFFLAKGLGSLFGFDPGHTAGLLAGSMTSTPTLAAAQDAIESGRAALPRGMEAKAMLDGAGAAYAITYIFGMLGLVFLIKRLPALLGLNLAEEAVKLAREKDFKEEGAEDPAPGFRPGIRVFQVTCPDYLGKPLKELAIPQSTACVIQQIKRGDKVMTPDMDTVLQENDLISLMGPLEKLEELTDCFGQGVFDPDLFKAPIETAVVIVNHPDAVGKRVQDLHTLALYGCFITRIVRAQIELPVNINFKLEKGDALSITGVKGRLERLIQRLGYVERNIVQTDLATFALGIVLGLGLGSVIVKAGAVSIGLGYSGGLLFSGMLVGFLRAMNPTFGRVPPAARWVLMEMGLMFFMAGVGLKAGGTIIQALGEVGLPLFFSGVAVTTMPVAVALVFGKWVLRMNPVLLMGAITGSMTSTPSLHVLTQEAGSSLPALGYAGAYTFANVFMALAGTLLVMF